MPEIAEINHLKKLLKKKIMKKVILWVFITLLTISTLSLFSFNALQAYRGNDVTTYTRFYSDEGKGPHFNFWSLLSPFQSESRKIIRDTINFTRKVVYPIGPHFNLVPPVSNDSTEDFVAEEIAQVISDSVNKIKMDLSLDYDGQAIAVRNAVNPTLPTLAQPKILLDLLGTASPEALKYGFEKSLQPEVYEDENSNLASARLQRTSSLIEKKLKDLKIPIENIFLTSCELQLHSKEAVAKVLRDRSLLDTMRYVQANVCITTQRVEITPITTPIGLAIELPFLFLLLLSLRNFKMGLPLFRLKDLWSVLKVVFIVATIFLVILFSQILLEKYLNVSYVMWATIIIAALIVIAMLVLLLVVVIKNWKEFLSMLKAFLELFLDLIEWIIFGLAAVIIFVVIYTIRFIVWLEECWSLFKIWWKSRTIVAKALYIHFLIDFIVFITWLAGWWTISF